MVQSLSRAFEIVRCVAASDDGIRLQDLAKLCALKKTTVFNLAETLVKEGMLLKDDNSRYQLGILATELHLGGRGRRNLHRTAAILDELHRQFSAAEITYTELGEGDIFGRLHLPAGQPGKIRFTDGLTFNPYITVCGILYFAFIPDERLNALRMRNPFSFKGSEIWGSEEAFQECVARARRCGWAEAPILTRPNTFRIGVPVLDANDNLVSTITFGGPCDGLPPKKIIIKELIAAARRIDQL